jgi:hypothetical protein
MLGCQSLKHPGTNELGDAHVLRFGNLSLVTPVFNVVS